MPLRARITSPVFYHRFLKGLSKKPDGSKSQTHRFIVMLRFFRFYQNRPLRNPQPVVRCMLCDYPLPLAAYLPLYSVMIVVASSDADLVLELLYNGIYSWKIAEQTLCLICGEYVVCKYQHGHVLWLFAWIFTDDRRKLSDQWWWYVRFYWGMRGKDGRAIEYITAPFE